MIQTEIPEVSGEGNQITIQAKTEPHVMVKIDNIVTHPRGYKKHHRWQWGWQKFRAVVDFIGKVWPKNP